MVFLDPDYASASDFDLYAVLALWAGFPVIVLYFAYYIGSAFISKFRRLIFSDLLLTHFAVLVKLRMPLQEFAGACHSDLSKASGRDLADLESGLRKGRLLGDAMGQVPLRRRGLRAAIRRTADSLPGGRPNLITPTEAEVLRVGETSGNLDMSLQMVINERRRSAGLMTYLYASLLYPLAVIVILSTIALGLATYIVPKFKKMFQELDVSLPYLTQVVIGVFAHIWIYIALVPVALITLFLLWLARSRLREMHRSRDGSTSLFRRIMLAPGYLLRIGAKQRLAEFCRELAMLLRVGTPANRALEVIASGTMNPWFRDRVRQAQMLCEKGVSLPIALEQAKLDRRAAWYTRAEGSPSEMADGLIQIGDEYMGKHHLAINVFKELAGPIAILLVGILVGFVFAAFFLPILRLIGSMG